MAGCAASYALIGSADFSRVLSLSGKGQLGFFLLWIAIAAAAVAQEIVLTGRAARRQGVSALERPARLATLALVPNVLAASVISVRLLADGLLLYLAPVWMMCYGTGVYAAGLFSLRLSRLLGLAFIITGAIAMLACPQCGVIFTAVSFGLFHIAFGLIVLRRAKQDAHDA